MSGYVAEVPHKRSIYFSLEEIFFGMIYLLIIAADGVCWLFGCPPVALGSDPDDYRSFSGEALPVQKEGYLANLVPIEVVAWLLLPFSVGIGWGKGSPEVWGWLALASLVVLVIGAMVHQLLER